MAILITLLKLLQLHNNQIIFFFFLFIISIYYYSVLTATHPGIIKYTKTFNELDWKINAI